MRVIERPVRIRALSIVRARGIRAMYTGCFTARARPSPRDGTETIRPDCIIVLATGVLFSRTGFTERIIRCSFS